ncbi:unnamed protein product [Clonostachys byssicola]|uniref:Uncharacterized protein n=1 Tax=Clonostachys byssicola TaxID=160290 RepID=A0A9N9UMI2_9HYPO|nr:unnamed protein product [Clonostachys byssicola]
MAAKKECLIWAWRRDVEYELVATYVEMLDGLEEVYQRPWADGCWVEGEVAGTNANSIWLGAEVIFSTKRSTDLLPDLWMDNPAYAPIGHGLCEERKVGAGCMITDVRQMVGRKEPVTAYTPSVG